MEFFRDRAFLFRARLKNPVKIRRSRNLRDRDLFRRDIPGIRDFS